MSQRGRYWIDRLLKHGSLGKWFTWPVPPYQDASYWQGVYQHVQPTDESFEWGDFKLQPDLAEYQYRLLLGQRKGQMDGSKQQQDHPSAIHRTSFAETLGVPVPSTTKESSSSTTNNDDSAGFVKQQQPPILLLGCGNSKLGEDLCDAGYDRRPHGMIVQVDVVSRVLETMEERCQSYVTSGRMKFVQDDATKLSAFPNASMQACVDKGLLDALFCANQYEQLKQVMRSAHRVLVPQGVLCVFSFSQPEFLLSRLWKENGKKKLWKDIQVRELDKILLYRFQKNDHKIRKGKRHPRQRRQ